jgi:hypothetical protein
VLTALPSMILGTVTSAAKTAPVSKDREHLPLLIVGREHAIETLARLALDDIHQGKGVLYSGDADRILPFVPKDRMKDVILFEVNVARPIAFNVFDGISEPERSQFAQHVLDAFAAVWESRIATTQFDRYMRLAVLATCAIPDGTLYSLPYLFTSEGYRTKAIGRINDMTLKNRIQGFDALTNKEREDRVLSLMNRLDPLLLDESIRNIIAQKKSFRFTDTSILIVSLPKGQNYNLLAALAMSRWNGRSYIERPHLHVGASVPIVACRYLSEMQEQFRERMLGNATIMAFRTGGRDEQTLKPYFELYDQSTPLTRLPPWSAYVQLDDTRLIDGYAHSYPADPKMAKKLRDHSRVQYGVPRVAVEKRIDAFLGNIDSSEGQAATSKRRRRRRGRG